ncbi:MAG: 4-hydroxybutyrate--acetyl-CoA CoA transferase [Clostridiales bacterium]|nr:4-hydroxybutyrate--acetyl-CoA CoA transferase [Clostridiales bacterium]
MNMKNLYNNKTITVNEALDLIKSGDEIVTGLAVSEARAMLSRLHEIHEKVKDVTVVTCLPMKDYAYFVDKEYRESFKMAGWFYTATMRKAHKERTVSLIPTHLHSAAKKRSDYNKPDIYIGVASPMDQHGYLSLSLGTTYERETIKRAKTSILEINPNMPRTFGDTTIHISEIDYMIEVDYQPSELPVVEPTEKEIKIGRHIAELVEDGSTLQLGIGGIPNAVAASLKNKKDIGIHTEMFTDGMVDMYRAGAITNRKKTLMPDKMVATFALGSKKLYDFIDDNPGIVFLNGSWVNDPCVIGKNYKMVSINTTIEIDLTGQCCSESIGHRQFSGTGGQSDTAVGAQRSIGGKSIIALTSTAMVKNNSSGERKEVSKIVNALRSGAAVTLSRNDVDYVVTEYGVAALRGASIRERVERLINIAHPKFRDHLKNEAERLLIW